VAPGASSPALTQRCGGAVQAQYEGWRAQAVAGAQASVAAGGDHDAGHYLLEGASVWRVLEEELRRRPWLGSRRFFRIIDDEGGVREATERDAPALAPLSAFEDRAFAAWREEETEGWSAAARACEEALQVADAGSDVALLGEVGACLVRAHGKMRRPEDLARAVREVSELLAARGADPRARAMVHVRHGDGLLGDERGREAADAYAAASALLGPSDQLAGWLLLSQGLALLRSADFAGARERLAAAVNVFEGRPAAERPIDEYAPALHNLGLTLEHEGQLEEAERCFREALALRESAGPAHHAQALDSRVQLARVLARRGGPHARDARAHLDQLRPFVAPGTMFEGLLIWTEAVIEHSTGGDKVRLDAMLRRAAALLQGDPAWSSWIADEIAGL
jgi:tetratricopeptide (TPR) repeat protein